MSTHKQIEVVGVWLPNKGAELMAHTVVTELTKRLPGTTFVSTDQGSSELRKELGFISYRRRPRANKYLETIAKISPPFARYVTRSAHPQTTHVIDISGFAYGDYWGPTKARRRAGNLCDLAYPVFLLPQAFGPFSDPELAKIMTKVVRKSAFIGARDRTSHDHLSALAPEKTFPQLPDITFSLDVSSREVSVPQQRFACLVLNSKTVATGAVDEEKLLGLYAKSADILRNAGYLPQIVLHEPKSDRELSEKLSNRIGADVIEIHDARDLKAYIHKSEFVITGRFHGLVNGLSGGVPSFAVGWSHKYVELLSDFECPDFIYDGDEETFIASLQSIVTSPEKIDDIRSKLRARAASNKVALSEMWDNIAEAIQRS